MSRSPVVSDVCPTVIWKWVWVMLGVMTLVVLDPTSLWEHVRNSANPYIFTDDVAQQIWPILKWHAPDLFRDDYIADYYLDAYLPRGYVGVMGLASGWVDPRLISKVLPYVMYLIVLVAVCMAGWRMGQGAACWSSFVLCLGTGVFLLSLVGGLPRSFGYPVIAILVLGLVLGRPWVVVLATVVGASFYYVSAVISGLALAVYLLILPERWRGLDETWTLRRRFLVVALTGVLAVILVSPALFSGDRYGALVGPDRYEEFPEAGTNGRYDDLEGSGVLPQIMEQPLAAVASIFWVGDSWGSRVWPGSRTFLNRHARKLAAVVIFMCAVGFFLRRSSPAARRLLIVPVVSLAGLQMSIWWEPYFFIPARYASLVAPVLVMVLLPLSLLSIFGKVPSLRNKPDLVKALSVSACVGLVFFAAGRTSRTGLNVQIPEEDVSVYSFIGGLPDEALIAGLPKGLVENVPYLSEKKILHSYETHMVFHEQYMLVMRQRLSHLLEALYATSLSPLIFLRDEYQVTHLVVEKERYSEFAYFPPFDSMVDGLAEQVDQEPGFLVDAESAIVFEHGEVVVIDLSRLGSASTLR